MNLQPQIKTLAQKKLIGMHLNMSMADNRTLELWRSFMPKRKEITNTIGGDLYSVQVYDDALGPKDFTPRTLFEKWAAVEVSNLDNIPADMSPLIINSGLYAVFQYKGAASAFAPAFNYIFNEWLPGSGYTLDQRPHFEVMGEKYKNDSSDSEEEIWVPIRK